ncbi:aldehyde dehydrogenase (NADP(+)) [Cryobacterium soli]|uniref:aldehyde dehydrogenase (NADP(+)) n=1 Tax=Cryobacterium soli TaxID=2220095 RepID=UPI000E7605FF|nr:aldehyde dehydrogenase (NADP(+)) [Cryobacterium soli]
MTLLTTTDPRTGVSRATAIEATTAAEVHALVDAAVGAFQNFRWSSRVTRAALLDGFADALEANRPELVDLADAETGLGTTRLTGEVGRSAFQFRLFAEALREGSYLEATLDSAGDTPLGHGPDLRRMLVPIGPVAVFGSSNFPFAFSVAGGDTASAVAAGNPVVLKAHGSHPLTSQRSFEVLADAAAALGAPAGLLGIVYGLEAGRTLVAEPGITAVGFTGSLGAAEALIGIIGTREQPIPFFGELSSLNPLLVTPAAATARADEIAAGLFGSFTLGAGQFCTKPGLVFVPTGAAGDRLVAGIVARADSAEGAVLLNERIANSFEQISARLVADGHGTVVARGSAAEAGFGAAPTVLLSTAVELTPALTEEAFGPLLVIVRYDTLTEVYRALDAVPDSLTATIQHTDDDDLAEIVRQLAPRAGRLVFNGYPTGVRVSWAQHHGGNWPATNTQHTSVGVSAIRRFLRPLAFQDAPAAVLPAELHDDFTGIPRRIDGRLHLPPAVA